MAKKLEGKLLFRVSGSGVGLMDVIITPITENRMENWAGNEGLYGICR